MVAISVIVPVHNGEKYLHKCLDSILNGTFRDLEVIVVENASTDSTLAICREYEAKYENVRVLTTDIPGVSHARNLGIEAAKGMYLAFVDADDYVSPDMYDRLYNCAIEMNSDFVICDYIRGEDSEYQFLNEQGQVKEVSITDFYYQMYMKCSQINSSPVNKLIHKNCVGNIRYDESLRYSEDRSWIQQCAIKAKKICYVNAALYYYRKNDSSISNAGDQHVRMHQIYSLQKDLAFFESQYPDKKLWQEYVAACLLQNADFRLRRVRQEGLKDLQAELKPIVKEAAGRVRRAKQVSRRDKFRFLLEHDCPPLFKLAAKITGH